jgi:hypothetical protein
MTDLERFQVEQVLAQVNSKLITESNSCELEFYKKLKVELEAKLKE